MFSAGSRLEADSGTAGVPPSATAGPDSSAGKGEVSPLGTTPGKRSRADILAGDRAQALEQDAGSLASRSTTGGSRGSSMAASRSELPDAQLPELLQPRDGVSPLGRAASAAAIGSSSNGIGGRSNGGSATVPVEDPSGVDSTLGDAQGSMRPMSFAVPPNWSGVPRDELERWCAQITSQLQIIMDTTAAKLAQCRTRMADKDEVIRRLHWRLQNAEWSSSAGSGGYPSGPHTPGRRGGSLRMGANAATSGGAANGSVSRLGDTAALCSPSGGASRSTRGGAFTVVSSPGAVSLGGSGGDSIPSSAATWGPGSKLSTSLGAPGTPTAPGRGGSPPSAQVGARLPVQNQVRNSRAAKETRDNAQIAYLRQEVAQLRRQNCELVNQVRERESQIDGLAGMVKDNQVATQQRQQMERRQLHLRDDAIQAMQEELLLSRSVPAGSGYLDCSDAGSNAPGETSLHDHAPVSEEMRPLNSARASFGASQVANRGVRRTTSDSLTSSIPHTARGAPGPQVQAHRASVAATAASAARAAASESSRAEAASERGNSVARSQSAFARHKERLAARRGSAGAPPTSIQVPSMTQAASANNPAHPMFSPRARRPGPSTMSSGTSLPLGSGGAAPAGTAAGIAQAAQAAVQAAAAQAAAAAQSARASSADGRGRTRGSAAAVRRGARRQ